MKGLSERKNKLPDMNLFKESDYDYLITSYKKMRSLSTKIDDSTFFKQLNVKISFQDVDQLLHNMSSIRVWIFLINYIITSVKQYHIKVNIYFGLFIIKQYDSQNQKLVYEQFPGAEKHLLQITFKENSQIESIFLLIKNDKKYQGSYYQIKIGKLILIDYLKENHQSESISIFKTILKERFEIKLEDSLVQRTFAHLENKRDSDSSELIFETIFQIFDGQDILKLDFVVIQTGFNGLDAKYSEFQENNNELRREAQQEYIVMRKLEELNKNKSDIIFQNEASREKLANKDQMKQQIKVLEKRIRQIELDDKELIHEEKVKENLKGKYERQIEEEVDSLDNFLRIQQSLKRSMQVPSDPYYLNNLKNLYNVLEGRFNAQLFRGLGLDYPDKESQILMNLRKLNREKILNPLLEGKNIFNQARSRNHPEIIAYFQGISITKLEMNDFQNNVVSPSIVEFFLSFLMFFQSQNQLKDGNKCTFLKPITFQQLIMNTDPEKLSKIFDKQIIKNWNRVLFPIKSGFTHEYQLVLIDFSKFQIIHYHLCELPYSKLSQKQYIQQSWEMNEELNIKDQRQKDQDRVLKAVILWIQEQTKFENIQDLGDMRLWKIRLSTNIKVTQARDTGLFMLLLCAFIVYENQVQFHDNKILNFINGIKIQLQIIINQQGIGSNEPNQQSLKMFKEFMNQLIMELQQ